LIFDLVRKTSFWNKLLVKLKLSLRKCYGHHYDLVDRYGISMSQMTNTRHINFLVWYRYFNIKWRGETHFKGSKPPFQLNDYSLASGFQTWLSKMSTLVRVSILPLLTIFYWILVPTVWIFVVHFFNIVLIKCSKKHIHN
jgi:hypothetical protein